MNIRRFSGLTEEIISKESRTLRDVQAVLLSMFHSRTILIGHSLDSDLKALKIIHDTVVDTSVLYPHKMGLPKKKALKTLCIDHLKRIIQENGERASRVFMGAIVTGFNRDSSFHRARPQQRRGRGSVYSTDQVLFKEPH